MATQPTIYHNPNCGTSRKVLGLLRESGTEPRVIEYLKTPPTRERLRRKLEALKADPFEPQNSKSLKGRNDQRSARVGGFRILFRVNDLDIIVAEIGPRGEIYKHGQ